MSEPTPAAVADVIIQYAADSVAHHLMLRVGRDMTRSDISTTKQAVKELLAEMGDVKEVSIFDLYKMANELLEDYIENQEDLNAH